MSYLLRPWIDRDAGVDLEISRANYPEYIETPLHPDWFPARQLGAPREYSSRYVAADTNTDNPIAYATLWELRPRRYRFDLAVLPEFQRQGIGAQLFDKILFDTRALGATGLQARVRDDKSATLEFIRRRGFIESHRMHAYRLDFACAYPLPDALAVLSARGIDVTNLCAEREHNPHHVEQFHNLYSAARHGWTDPDPDPAGPAQFSLATARRWLDECSVPDALFIARQDGRYVGFSSFFDIGTAVHPDYRGHGLATLLKSVSIADAQQRGYKGQTTATGNPVMEKVLQKLGYRRLRSEIRLIRELRHGDSQN